MYCHTTCISQISHTLLHHISDLAAYSLHVYILNFFLWGLQWSSCPCNTVSCQFENPYGNYPSTPRQRTCCCSTSHGICDPVCAQCKAHTYAPTPSFWEKNTKPQALQHQCPTYPHFHCCWIFTTDYAQKSEVTACTTACTPQYLKPSCCWLHAA